MFPFRWSELLEKYKAIWIKTKDLKNNELNTLPVYDDRYIKTKVRKYDDKVHINFHGIDVPKDESFHSHFY